MRLPNGVFAPYTGIPTNLLFFDRTGPTREIWYYEIPKRENGNYSKSKPMQFEEFASCLAWVQKPVENEQAWKVKVDEVLKYDGEGKLVAANLDRRNPNAKADLEHIPAKDLAASVLAKEQKILGILEDIHKQLNS